MIEIPRRSLPEAADLGRIVEIALSEEFVPATDFDLRVLVVDDPDEVELVVLDRP